MEPPVLLVTGMSGAGKSVALNVLEDVGYEVVDNLPLDLLGALLQQPVTRPLAVGVDARTRAFEAGAVLDKVAAARRGMRATSILFLDCSTSELIRRYSETRRPHPLAEDGPAPHAIARERLLLADLRAAADVVIDTSRYTRHDLGQAVRARFSGTFTDGLKLTLLSFGYAEGVPADADLMFDMRFLRNPHWEPDLRPLSGTDPAVQAYVQQDPGYAPAFAAIMDLLALLLPRYAAEGRAYLTVAFGCTGGRHRSVAVAQAAGMWLEIHGWANSIVHRDRGLAEQHQNLAMGAESPDQMLSSRRLHRNDGQPPDGQVEKGAQ